MEQKTEDTFTKFANKLLTKFESEEDAEMYAFCRIALHEHEQMQIMSTSKMWSQFNRLAEDTLKTANDFAEKAIERI
jgi:hypothetical protein